MEKKPATGRGRIWHVCMMPTAWVVAFALCFACTPSASAQSAEPIQTVIPVNIDISTGDILMSGHIF
jgi:hypothetical protein